MIVGFKLHLLQIEHDIGDVLDYARECGELVLRTSNFYRGNGRAFERRKQNASERISNRVPITGLKRLGGELGVNVCGCALVFGESFRHFKTTVTNWHSGNLEAGITN